MYRRPMTAQELQAWVERVDSANARHPQMVTVMDDGEMMLWMLEHPAAIIQWQTGLFTLDEVLFEHSIVPASREQMLSAAKLLRAQPDYPEPTQEELDAWEAAWEAHQFATNQRGTFILHGGKSGL